MRILLLLFLFPACSFLEGKLATKKPPLFDMEEPLALFAEADDEGQRQALPAGGFTGAYVTDARRSLEEMEDEPEGVLVMRVVENSPAAAAGLSEGDLIVLADGQPLQWASEWRALELAAAPDSVLKVTYDRAGVEHAAQLTVVARVHLPERQEADRFREEDKVGIVLRTATEVEARAAGLGPGGGAVVVGLSRASPWRKAGLRFGDLIVEVGGESVAHPHVLLKAIRDAPRDGRLALVYLRGVKRHTVSAPVTKRASRIHKISIPLLLDIEEDRGTKTVSILLGLYKRTRTPAAWEVRLLWFIKIRGGDADRLEEVKE